MSDITVGRLRGGYCVIWHEGGKRRRHQLKARTRAEAESEARDRYLKETARPGGMNVAEIWEAYRVHLGTKKTAETMGWTGKAVLAKFGALRPDHQSPATEKPPTAKAGGKSFWDGKAPASPMLPLYPVAGIRRRATGTRWETPTPQIHVA